MLKIFNCMKHTPEDLENELVKLKKKHVILKYSSYGNGIILINTYDNILHHNPHLTITCQNTFYNFKIMKNHLCSKECEDINHCCNLITTKYISTEIFDEYKYFFNDEFLFSSTTRKNVRIILIPNNDLVPYVLIQEV